ncbi:MAG: polyprenyl synthetase family protein [Pyrinomonadaceae bacterium]
MFTTQELLSTVGERVDSTLDQLVPSAAQEPKLLHQAIRWGLFPGGKRIRPAIVIAAGLTFEAREECLWKTAAALEMIHSYSLIHDDLPAMDNDDLRRGRASCHRQFGQATAILAGDALQTLAFKAIAEDTTLSPDKRVELISLLADSAGTPSGMISGQQLDLQSEEKNLAAEEIDRIHQQKTGALIAFAAIGGAVIGNASPQEVVAVQDYASHLGLLFQVTDDLLDVTAETSTLGKTAGKDAGAGKATYPRSYGVDRTKSIIMDIHEKACQVLKTIGRDTAHLSDLAHFVVNRNN